jgi:sister-chromatid-cohesion protein PDS5
MQDIFRLFTSVFEGLNEVTGSSYLKRVAVLESLSKVKSCVMILDLDDEELVLRFMETLFDAIQ